MDSWKLQLWRRLSPGKNPPLMLEHLGFHPAAPPIPPPSPPSLPPLSLYIPPPSVGAVLVLENFYPSIQCIWRAEHCMSEPKERKTQRAEPLPPPSPIFTGRAHAPDPAHPRNRPTGSAHLSVQRRTNKPPSTVCSVSHPTSPSISITPLL